MGVFARISNDRNGGRRCVRFAGASRCARMAPENTSSGSAKRSKSASRRRDRPCRHRDGVRARTIRFSTPTSCAGRMATAVGTGTRHRHARHGRNRSSSISDGSILRRGTPIPPRSTSRGRGALSHARRVLRLCGPTKQVGALQHRDEIAPAQAGAEPGSRNIRPPPGAGNPKRRLDAACARSSHSIGASWLAAKRLATEIETVRLTAPATLRDGNGAERAPSPWLAGLDPADHGHSTPRLAKAAGCGTWSPRYAELTRALVTQSHALELKVVPWTVNSPDDMMRLIDSEVDGLITDYPDRARGVMASKGLPLP